MSQNNMHSLQPRRGLCTMDWKDILRQLRERGWTQQLLADRVGASQSAISDLSSGKTKDPAHSIGRALVELLESGIHQIETDERAKLQREYIEATRAMARLAERIERTAAPAALRSAA